MAKAVPKMGLTAWAGFLSVLLLGCGGGGVSPPPPPVSSISISPKTVTTPTGTGQQFTATVTGSIGHNVNWSIDGAGAGNSTVGTIKAPGFYTAPGVPPSPNNVTVRATSVANPSLSDFATVTVVNPSPAIVSILPNTVNVSAGDTMLTVTGTGFAPQSTVSLGATSLATTFGSSTRLTAVVPAALLATAGTFPLTVTTPSPGGGTSNATNLNVLVVVQVSPSTETLDVNQTLQFTATVAGSANQGVTWFVNDIAVGNATFGAISSSGLYTAPAVVPFQNILTVKAASVVDPSRAASATVTLTNPPPVINSISPLTINAGSGNTPLTIKGVGFTSQSTLKLGGNSLTVTLGSPTQLNAIIPAAQLATAGTFPVTVVNPSPGGGTSNGVNMTVLITVTVSPTTQTLNIAQAVQFTATVTGSTNQAVTWSVNNTVGGDTTVGTINSAGLYTAPPVPPSPNIVTVTATSVADPARTATASLTLVNPLPVINSISPLTIVVGSGDTSLTVNGTGFTSQSTVKLGSNSLTTTFGSSTQLTASIPAAQLTLVGTFPVTVVTPSPGGGISGPVNLKVVVVVTVTPPATTLAVGQNQTFSSTVTGSTNQTVTWSISGAGTGNSTVGTINSTTGVYTAPAVPPTPNTVSIVATAAADNTRSGSATATIVNPAPALNSLTPNTINAGSGNTTITVDGSGFARQSSVLFNGTALATSFGTSTRLTAIAPAALLTTAGTFQITVTTPSPGGGTSTGASLRVVVVVTVIPSSPTVNVNQSQPFSATVTGSTNQNVTWSIDGAGAGNSTLGAISSTGLYTAPSVVPSPPIVTVRAPSVFDNTSSGTAAATIASPGEDWPKYRRDLANTGRSAETGLSSANVSLLKKKWTFDTGGKVSASPAVATVGGVSTVFVGSWSGNFFALNALTGQKIWSFAIDPVVGCVLNNPSRIGSSAAVESGIVYFGAVNGFVYALDGTTGGLVWKIQLGDPCLGYEIWSSPAVDTGVVYVGVASHNSAPCVAGRVVALNATTGAIVWSFDTVDQTTCPVPGTCLGAAIWSSPAIDTTFNTLYIGTGNAGLGCVPSTPNATDYPDGVIALNTSTGAFKSFYQAVPNDSTDAGDVGSSPVLHTTGQCAGSGPFDDWVSAADKNSIVYTFPRGNTGFLGSPIQTDLASGELIASPALVPSSTSSDCNHIFCPSGNGHLFDLRQGSDGTITIDQDIPINITGGCATPGNCPLFSAPASITDVVFFGGGEGNFYAYSTSGQKLFSTGTLGLVASGPAISHSRVYFGSFDHFVYCLSINGQ